MNLRFRGAVWRWKLQVEDVTKGAGEWIQLRAAGQAQRSRRPGGRATPGRAANVREAARALCSRGARSVSRLNVKPAHDTAPTSSFLLLLFRPQAHLLRFKRKQEKWAGTGQKRKPTCGVGRGGVSRGRLPRQE